MVTVPASRHSAMGSGSDTLASLDAYSRQRFGLETDVVDPVSLAEAISRCRDRGIRLPRFSELGDPAADRDRYAERTRGVAPDEPDPGNLWRIHWFNDVDRTGLTSVPAHIVLPESMTGVEAPIVVMLGDRFPMIHAHKVLAAYACLAPRLVTGRFSPSRHRAVWPSTGNYCRGGIAVSRIMGCRGVAVLPENMSRERFEWLQRWVGSPTDIVRTVGSESNVKEIYDACRELEGDPQNVILNQFCEFGNALAHYQITGGACARVAEHLLAGGGITSIHSYVSATGSAGTLSAGDRLKELFGARVAAVEAAECPTLTRNGFGEHHIQGIGDKHVPYIHNAFGTDDLVAVSDAASDAMYLLATEPAGRAYLADRRAVPADVIDRLSHIGLSGWANVLAAVRLARANGLDRSQAILTVATDGADLYRSERERILRMRFPRGFDDVSAAEAFGRWVLGNAADHIELRREDRERIFNLGYFTWVEQQGVPVESFVARRRSEFWRSIRGAMAVWDERIAEFNARVDAG